MTSIEWAQKTWNPTSGCTKVSPGCKHCYAETFAKRLRAMGKPGYQGKFTEVICHPTRLDIPRRRRKPTTWFVDSMSDLFHEDVPFKFIDRVFATIAATPQHRYQILTKRPARMVQYCVSRKEGIGANVVLGTSIENKETADLRLEIMRRYVRLQASRPQLQAKIFLSIEPLLEDLGVLDLTGIDWVIVGGESGRKARPIEPAWVLSIRAQCQTAGVPFFFKQWGCNVAGERASKKRHGRLLEGVEYNEMLPGWNQCAANATH